VPVTADAALAEDDLITELVDQLRVFFAVTMPAEVWRSFVADYPASVIIAAVARIFPPRGFWGRPEARGLLRAGLESDGVLSDGEIAREVDRICGRVRKLNGSGTLHDLPHATGHCRVF
jgi:hypothetical protein